MADLVEPIERPDGPMSTGRDRRLRRLRVAALAALLVVALGVLAFRFVVTSAYTESCAGVGVGVPVVTSADTDRRLIDGAATPREALDALLSDGAIETWRGYLQRVDDTGAPDPDAPPVTADDFAFHGGDHPSYTIDRGHGTRTVIHLQDADHTWRVIGIDGCSRD